MQANLKIQRKDQQMINIDTWQSGTYVITLKQKGEIIESTKLTLVNK